MTQQPEDSEAGLSMLSMTTCAPDCPCQHGLGDGEVVPYQDTLGCPTDEELLLQWSRNRCTQSLAWWVARVSEDRRYTGVVMAVQRQFPAADVAGCVGDVLVKIWSTDEVVRRPLTYFRLLLWQGTLRDVGGGRTVKVHVVDPSDELEVLAAYRCDHLADRSELLADCYDKLGERARAMMDAYYYQDQPITQIAERERLTYDACARRLSRTRVQLRDCIEQSA